MYIFNLKRISYNEVKGGEKMIEKRLDRIEEMLTQLIEVIGTISTSQNRMEVRLDSMEAKNEERHQDILNQLKQLEVDQDIIWEKVSKEEREIAKIKKRLEN
jgi:hypothetical protein